ncbi:MAG: family 16 glycosylhydrolase [Saprospiraceae bacterium]|nr:family 16 glycosylhydrolase [Saprospiraceae bacterium]
MLAILSFLPLIAISACGNKDDDSSSKPIGPGITVSPISQSEGNDASVFEFQASLSSSSDKQVTFDYTTRDKSAKTGEDYLATSGSLSFATGETEKTIAVTILPDIWEETNEVFELVLSNPINGILVNSTATGTIVNDDNQESDEGYTTPDNYAGYNLVWQDEFNGTSIDETSWIHEEGASGWGNNELQYYSDKSSNSYVSDGKLVIEARKESLNGAPYTSARMKTQGRHEFQYGRIDIRAKLPTGKGIWPALWMLGDDIATVSWPRCGEIDIMEIIGSEPATLHGTVHWDNNGSYANYGKSTMLANGTFADKYHVFTIIWDEQYIKWLLDDVEFNIIDITPAALSEFHHEFFFLFNIAVGGNWPGSPDATTIFPQQMKVDYVRVFQEI